MEINRRGFFKIISAAGAGHFLGSSQKVFAQEHFPGYPDRFGILTDLTRCVGCRTCEAACNKANNLPTPEIPFEDKSVFKEKREADAKYYTYVNRYEDPKGEGEPVYRKVQCNHCDEPACASACLVQALRKTPEGAVIWNEKVCIGCRYCMTACPFYVPAYEYSNSLSPDIVKCTMCYDTRISKGDIPACVEACPMEVMTFGKRSDVIKAARERITREPNRYIDYIYGEHEVGGTGWLYISGVPFEQLDFPMNVGMKPYPELTRGFLSMVPAVIVIWPALLWGFHRFTQHREQVAEGEDTSSERKEHQV